MTTTPVQVISVPQVRSWAGLLAGEARGPDWLQYSYVVPDVLNDIALELVTNIRGLIGLVGPQGVGKSSALLALELIMYLLENGPRRQSQLVKDLGVEPSAMSRLLTKLELHRYVVRERAGTDKIVSLRAA